MAHLLLNLSGVNTPIMRFKLFICLLWGVIPVIAYGQYENIWAFGKNAGLDFNSTPPTAIYDSIYGFGEANAAVCNAGGELLFYTEGATVWDRNNNIMPHGSYLLATPMMALGGPDHNDSEITSSTTQGALIVPIPDSAGKYYIFSLTGYTAIPAGTVDPRTIPYIGNVYYSVVDMNLNGGLGDVDTNREGMPVDIGNHLSEKMIGIVGDRCNIWLLLHALDSGIFKAYEITTTGINSVPVVSIVGKDGFYGVGHMEVSPNRKKIVTANNNADLYTINSAPLAVFDFNATTGEVSNPVILDSIMNAGYDPFFYGAAFSPDNSKLYVQSERLYQFDMNASNIIASRDTIGDLAFSQLKLGPDNKIYGLQGLQGDLSVINAPNLAGAACQYTPNAINLFPGTSSDAGLDNAIPVFVRDTVHSTQQVNLCFKDSTVLYANDSGWDYKWSNGNIQTYNTVDSSGDYTVRYYTAPCRYHIDTFVINMHKIPVAGAGEACYNRDNGSVWVLLPAGDTSLYHYFWSNVSGALQDTSKTYGDTLSGVAPGIYYVQINDNDGCDTSISVTLPQPGYQASFSVDTLACSGYPVQFHNASIGQFASWSWNFGDSTASQADSPAHIFVLPGSYLVTLVAATSTPCYDTAYATIKVDSALGVSFTTDKQSMCVGGAITCYPVYDANDVTALLWNFGDSSSVTSWLPTHAYAASGQMIVSLTARYRACPDTSYYDTVQVYPYPAVDIGPDTALCPDQQPVTLTNLSARNTEYHNLWSTGDSSDIITVKSPGNYWLHVTTDHGCSLNDSVLIKRDCYIAIPNAFTPNDDGINDYFFPRQFLSMGLASFHMQIFNRWGQQIFETVSTDGRGWDGKFNGKEQPPGVYIYLIEASFIDGAQEKHQGNITLIK